MAEGTAQQEKTKRTWIICGTVAFIVTLFCLMVMVASV